MGYSALTRDWTHVPYTGSVEVWSLSHWATREVPQLDYQILFISEKIHICLGSSDLPLFILFFAGFVTFIHILFGE